jgi:toxin FitB
LTWLIDTDVLSQPAKRFGNENVIAWLRDVENECYTSTVVIAQIAYWVRKQQGIQRARLQEWLRTSVDTLEGRILSFNTATAHVWAEYRLIWEKDGTPMPLEDSYIAATAIRHNLTIATGNAKDFRRTGLKVFNPFEL